MSHRHAAAAGWIEIEIKTRGSTCRSIDRQLAKLRKQARERNLRRRNGKLCYAAPDLDREPAFAKMALELFRKIAPQHIGREWPTRTSGIEFQIGNDDADARRRKTLACECR